MKNCALLFLFSLIFPLLFTTVSFAQKSTFSQKDRDLLVRIDERLKQVDKRFDQIDKRFELIEKRFEQIDKRFELIEKRFQQMDKRFELIEKRIENLRLDINKKIDTLRADTNRRLEEFRFDTNKRIDELRSDTNKHLEFIQNLLIAMLGAFVSIVVITIGFALWDRRTMIRPFEDKVKIIEDDITKDKKKLQKLLEALKEYAQKDPRLAEILRSFSLF